MLSNIHGYCVIGFMHLLARLPLPLLRGIGKWLGRILFVLARPRRKVALTNLRLCFPDVSEATRKQWARETFEYFCQTWLDRSWLWIAKPEVLRQRLQLQGALHELADPGALILLAPHFYGLDAAGVALGLHSDRAATAIYMKQPNPVIDRWIQHGRTRFGNVRLFNRAQGLRPVVQTLREEGALYLLPDMNFGRRESIFVPFFGVQAATVASLGRFAKMSNGRVVPLLSQVTKQGYTIDVLPHWQDFPEDEVVADTTRMNREVEGYIRRSPSQYFWVHKRFKFRPPDEPSIY